MNGLKHPYRGWFRSGVYALSACALVGCAVYEERPIDLDAYRAEVALRLDRSDDLASFLDRLRSAGAETPDRFDLEDGVTRGEAEVLALFFNPDLRLQRLEAGVALASFEHAGLWDDPVFGFSGAEILSPAAPFEYGVTIGFTLPVSGRLEVEKQRAGAAYEAALRRVVDAEWSMRARVRSAWVSWSAAEEKAALLDGVVEQVGRIAELAERMEQAGALSRVEARLFEVERAARQAERSGARADALAQRIGLLGVLGLPPEADVELKPSMDFVAYDLAEDPLALLIERNTALASRRAEYQVAEETLRREVREQYPDITIGTGFGDEGDDRLLLGFSMPIPILNANRGGISEASAERDVARARAEITFERLAHDLARARTLLAASIDQSTRYATDVVPALMRQGEEVERLAELGDVNTLLLLETVTRTYEAKSRLLDLRRDEVEASAMIAALLGPASALEPAPVHGPSQNTDSHSPGANP